MARICVCAENCGLDPTKWRRGDVVEVFEDGQTFGREIENNPRFAILEIRGVPASKWQYLTEENMNVSSFTGVNGEDVPFKKLIFKRAFHLDIDALRKNPTEAGLEACIRRKLNP